VDPVTVRHIAAIVGLASGALLLGTADALPAVAATSFLCVSSDANTCVVTIPLTSDMNETVTSTMPDTQPWSLNEIEGNGTVTAPYELTADDFGGDFDGPPGSTEGHVWTEILTTGDNEPAGGDAVLTFNHVQSTPTAKPYTSLSWSTPNTAVRGAPVTVTAVVKPLPAKGHVILQRKVGSSWKTFATMTYSAKRHKWSATFKWTAGPHGSVTFRLDATAAPGLLTTTGKAFKIRTEA
jgi:hypothetical protein